MSDTTEKNLQMKLADASGQRAAHSVLTLACTLTCNVHSVPPNAARHRLMRVRNKRVSASDWAEGIRPTRAGGLSRTEKETLLVFQFNTRGVSGLICFSFRNWRRSQSLKVLLTLAYIFAS